MNIEFPWMVQSFFREAVIWKRLRHPNIVPFIGVTRTPLQSISEWMPNGTLTEYVERNPGVNRISLVSLSSIINDSLIDDDVRSPSYWMSQKASIIFTQTTRYTET